MNGKFEIKPIAYIRSDFGSKFGIPRQPGLVRELEARIIFEKEFRNDDALRGIQEYSHIWLIWQFSENADKEWSPTVRPPRLGGNTRIGVFATRSPFRPNALGLSCVQLIRTEKTETEGTVLVVSGADLMDGTPIFDIKPYVAYSDSIPDAVCGFAVPPTDLLEVSVASEMLEIIPGNKREALKSVLACDPRPRYQKDSDRIYGMDFAGHNIKFKVTENTLEVVQIT
ncbi:MAG: tRNA (N6-threonylcarbamoyladenosine(37)-N6)-methyltransferase TrmO [Eubacteriales bacterium]|nr:tRNA (N6-threonylcarbamoyladenosine(37)-N6)-methyltransferase TrmO [Eubacteriales bacterium]